MVGVTDMSADHFYSPENYLFFGGRKVWLPLSKNNLIITKGSRGIYNTYPTLHLDPRYSQIYPPSH